MIRLLLLSALVAAPCAAQDWQVVWSDEFDAPGAPDPTKWTYDIGGNGWGNQESQFYTDRPENARVEDGSLVIEAREEAYSGRDYTSARLVTRGLASWTYGRMEARIQLPEGQGIWPAFWMLAEDSPYGGWPTSGEIDVMEFLGHDTDRVHGTIHYGGGTYGPCRASRGAVQGHCFSGRSYDLPSGDFPDAFHTFAVEWEPREIRWYVDDTLFQTQTFWYSGAAPYPAPFDQPFHLLLNLAVGGQWPGYPDETTVFPQQMRVDYVRVYQDASAYPDVGFDGPADGSSVEAGATIELAATASEGATVEFLQGDGLLGTDAEAPYALDVAGVVDGCYSLRARVTNEAGYTTTSDPADVTVGAGCPDGSRAPYLMVPAPIPGDVEAEYYDLGGTGVAYRDLNASNTGGGIRLLEGVDVRGTRDVGGGDDLVDVTSREWVTYTVDVAETGSYLVQARVASADGGALRLSVDGSDLTGDVTVPSTGGEFAYVTAPIGTVELTAGRQVLRLDVRDGGFALNRLTFTPAPSTVGEEGTAGEEFGLQLGPNPASRRVDVTYQLPRPGEVDLAVYDATGRRVAQVAAGPKAAGAHGLTLSLDGFAPGLYVCVLETGAGVLTERLAVVR